MITIVLEDSDNRVLSKAASAGNEHYLIRDEPAFPLLSQLSEVNYDVFSQAEMDGLIAELAVLREKVAEAERIHIEDIIEMACRCRDDETLTLTFTPFA